MLIWLIPTTLSINALFVILYLFQVCLVLDNLYDIPCKILHVNKGDELKNIIDTLKNHFQKFGSPVMMGGDIDCSSKGVMGIHVSDNDASLLIVVNVAYILDPALYIIDTTYYKSKKSLI